MDSRLGKVQLFDAIVCQSLNDFRFCLWLLLACAGTVHAFPTDMCVGDRVLGSPNCTANDVQITRIEITPGSGAPPACVGGETLQLSLDVTVNFGSPERYDIGIFLSVRKDSLRVMMYGLTHSLHTALLCCLLDRAQRIFPFGCGGTERHQGSNKDQGVEATHAGFPVVLMDGVLSVGSLSAMRICVSLPAAASSSVISIA